MQCLFFYARLNKSILLKERFTETSHKGMPVRHLFCYSNQMIYVISIMFQKIHAFIPTIKNKKQEIFGTDSCKKEDNMKKEKTKVRPQRKYKDTMFRMLFREKKELLSLYNAMNGTQYTDGEEFEITTLENAIYMSYKNDISFVMNFELMLYEHQSTVNPNMPFRHLIY